MDVQQQHFSHNNERLWEWPNVPSTDEWIKQMYVIHKRNIIKP